MVNNSLVERPKMDAVTYTSNGEEIRLDAQTVRDYLVNGNGAVSDQEVLMFLNLCKYQHLNPFLREAYLIKYGSNSPATMVVGKDVFTKRAQKHPQFAGLQAGVIVRKTEKDAKGQAVCVGEPIEREGSMVYSGETLVGGWCKVYIKGYQVPMYESVSFKEYAGKKSDGTLNGQWAKMPATMIRKVAVAQGLREAFPDVTGGLYEQEEIPEASSIELPEEPVQQAKNEEEEAMNALFGGEE